MPAGSSSTTQLYLKKLARIFAECEIRSITVAHMEVPYCFGLVGLVHEALQLAGKDIPLRELTVSVQGRVCRDSSTDVDSEEDMIGSLAERWDGT